MLSASREDILQDNGWNEALVAASVALFVSSIATYNEQDLLKYTWTRYAKTQGSAYGTIFKSFFADLFRRLTKLQLLESQALTFEAANSLQIVPSIFYDDARPPRPLMSRGQNMRTYASAKYAPDDLSVLAVYTQNAVSFSQLVRQYVLGDQEAFRAQPDAWHSRLAHALSHTGAQQVCDLPIILLQDGQWMSSSAGPFYFAKMSDGLAIPNGIQIAIIDNRASQDQHRRNLYSALGAQKLDPTQVFQLILQQHRNHADSDQEWTIADFLEHAWFLHNAPSRPRVYNLSDLMVVASNNVLHSGSELYMDVPGSPFCASELFGNAHPTIKFIHEWYLRCPNGSSLSSWIQWLQRDLGVNTMPKLVGAGGNISAELRWLVEHRPSSFWMTLLKDHWDHYAPGLTHGKNTPAKTYLSNATVKCLDGGHRNTRLRDAYLPTPAIADEPTASRTVPMVAVEDPQHPNWLKLEQIGLRVTCDLRFYLSVLERLPTIAQTNITVEEISKVYSQIQRLAHTDGDKDLVRYGPTLYIASFRSC